MVSRSPYSIRVVRGGGEIRRVEVDDQQLEAVCRQALKKAQDLATHGCPFGDALPPRFVEIHDEQDQLLLRIAIDASLRAPS
jgi:hypothetical protein